MHLTTLTGTTIKAVPQARIIYTQGGSVGGGGHFIQSIHKVVVLGGALHPIYTQGGSVRGGGAFHPIYTQGGSVGGNSCRFR